MLVKSQAAAAAAAAPRWARALSATAPTRDASATTSAAPPRATPRAAPLPTRSVLEVSGPDAQKFLKGQMCKDVESLGGGYSGFLNASGRVLHTVFSIPTEPTKYLIAHDSGPDQPSPLDKLLPPFRLRSKVRIRDVSDAWDVWGAWGSQDVGDSPAPTATWRFGSGGAAERLWTWEDGERASLNLADGEVGCWDLRAGWGQYGMGRKLFVPKGQKPSLLAHHDLVTPDDYDLYRMFLGVPEGSAEIVPGTALPLESCMDVQGGVDFRKGCYLGQELTVRTYHTGATRKRILPIRLFPLDGSASPLAAVPASYPAMGPAPAAVDITYTPPPTAASKKSRSAGRILALHPMASNVGLALVRLEFAERVWGHGLDLTVADYASGLHGTLTAEIDGKQWGVYVGHGEAYASALAHTPPPPPPEE